MPAPGNTFEIEGQRHRPARRPPHHMDDGADTPVRDLESARVGPNWSSGGGGSVRHWHLCRPLPRGAMVPSLQLQRDQHGQGSSGLDRRVHLHAAPTASGNTPRIATLTSARQCVSHGNGSTAVVNNGAGSCVREHLRFAHLKASGRDHKVGWFLSNVHIARTSRTRQAPTPSLVVSERRARRQPPLLAQAASGVAAEHRRTRAPGVNMTV